MRRINWKTVSTLVALFAVAGCAERSGTAPSDSSSPASIMMAPSERPQLGLNGRGSSNDDTEFMLSPWGGTYLVGNHAVVFPAYSVCDPAVSSYGADTWDAPCTVTSAPLKVRAVVRTTDTGTAVDFTPSLRFAPSNNPNKWVWIYMYTPRLVGATDLSNATILYAPSLGATGIDDSLDDPSQRTYVDTKAGISMRRIKHFSGYATSSGRSCSEGETCADSVSGGGQ